MNIEIVAHRGYAGVFPENTMEAFRRSVALRADSIELDIHHSREGIPVVIHDDTLDRTTTTIGSVRSLPVSQIQAADAGSKFKPEFTGCNVPLLEEALKLCQDCGAGLQLEIKEQINEDEARALLHLLSVYDMSKRTMIISFYKQNLDLLRRLDAEIELGFLTTEPIALESLVPLAPSCLCAHYPLLLKHPELIQQARGLNVDVAVWTIRDVETAKQLVKLGVYRLTSDIPLNHQDLRL
ncbi:glycerophosphodiester phosphodiesterase [Paenibacillus sp. SC116]|uniref:glycerophosphodiester phosphodiesterase n=1 Tax=Paenibacillus sp. SC116 TaxID=2968986 RepID=UPI00215A863A|nr:glycerophosphodiester phosphodiesterase family protein [Paenibacillus sp. SC116]MCR8843983.1 glycerophosphodiester phosphodiesterase [Paenibacillus sp. SC116]